MKVLVLHNRYRSDAPSGENAVVDAEVAALAARGHQVNTYQRHSDDIAGWPRWRKAALPLSTVWGEQSRRHVASLLTEFAPDVVHLHNSFPLITPSVLYACRAAGVPVVTTLHNYRLGCAAGSLYRDGAICTVCPGTVGLPAIRHGCYRDSRTLTVPLVLGNAVHRSAWRSLVSAFIFISAAQQRALLPLGLPAERSFVKPNFTEPPQPYPQPHALTAKGHQVAFVGRLDEVKGVEVLLAAWDLFRSRNPRSRLRLVIAGDGPLRDRVSAWSAQRADVEMRGRVERDEVHAILAFSLAALVPSQWQEPFGLVAVEAMAAGTAPLVSDHGAFPELVTAGVDGDCFPARDAAALAAALAHVDDHPDEWRQRGRRAQRSHSERFTAGPNLDQLEAIYRFAIDRRAGSGRPVASQAESCGIAAISGGSPVQDPARRAGPHE